MTITFFTILYGITGLVIGAALGLKRKRLAYILIAGLVILTIIRLALA